MCTENIFSCCRCTIKLGIIRIHTKQYILVEILIMSNIANKSYFEL